MTRSNTVEPGRWSRGRRPMIVLSQGQGNPLLRGILEAAREYDWAPAELRFFGGALPPGPPPRGAIVDLLPTDRIVRRLRALRCPTVRIGHLPHPSDGVVPAVLPDLAAMGRMAAELGCACHLLRFESASSGDRGSAASRQRTRYRRRQRQFGEWLKGIPKPLGLLAYSDVMAGQLCSMAAQAGMAVPEDVAVLGDGNNVAECECAPLTLSSIDPDVERRGREAARLLHRLMDGEPAPSGPIMIPPKGIVLRHSTDVLATPDANVARALRFMWDHLDLDLSVNDVARKVELSRRKLERAFRRELGRGINAELHRKRLERVRELLVTTDMPIVDLAPAVGFKSKDYLHRTFRRAFGVTPRRYRLREKGP